MRLAINTVLITVLLMLWLANGACGSTTFEQAGKHLSDDLHRLSTFLQLPGYSSAVVHDGQIVFLHSEGYADREKHVPMRDDTPMGIASVTKTFTATILRQLETEGTISLEDSLFKYPINSYFSPFVVGDPNLKIKDVVSMTSGDVPGETFFYNGTRFNLLYGLFDTVSKTTTPESYMQQVRRRIIGPLDMSDTVCGYASSPDALKQRMAKRYQAISNNGPWKYEEAGPYWDVTWPSGGLISTVDDLAKYANALDSNTLISSEGYKKMTTPRTNAKGTPHPYAYGWFSQVFEGTKLDWAYGQGQAESAIFLRVPARRLTFIFLSNSNVASDEAQLAYGNIVRSPFALAFIKAFVSHDPDTSRSIDFDGNVSIIKRALAPRCTPLDMEELLNEAMLWQYRSDFTSATNDQSKQLVAILSSVAPDVFKTQNVYLLYLLVRLQAAKLRSSGLQILKAFNPVCDRRPMVALWMGDLYTNLGMTDQAIKSYELLANRSGFDDEWMKAEACDRLAAYFTKHRHADRARAYIWKSALVSLANHDEDSFKKKCTLLANRLYR